MAMLYCLGTLAALSWQGAFTPRVSPALQQPDQLRPWKQKALGAWPGFRLPDSEQEPPKCSQLPETGCSAWSHTPRADAINGIVFLEGQDMHGGFKVTHHGVKIQAAFKC